MSWLSDLFHLHQWSAWGEPYAFGVTEVYQRRRCTICGKIEERECGHQSFEDWIGRRRKTGG